MIVQLDAVSKSFGSRPAVDRLSLDVPKGICFGLLGPNGAGKTTTMRMVYGATRPTSGAIRVFGLDIAKNTRAVRARLGVTLQQNVLIEALTPEENLRVFGRYHLLREPQLSQRVAELIVLLELASHARVPVKQLSGGFQRRLAIALSLMNRPELLILDEPTTGLDPAVRLALWGRVRELRAAGMTVMLSTHYMDEAERLCDRVAIISAGRVVDQGPPTELIARHLAPEVVEMDCSPEEETALLDGLGAPRHRMRVGGRMMVYLDDAAPLIDQIRRREPERLHSLVVRPANLEDVFLKLTGTMLEAGI